jgi:hypothetical protein
MTEYMTATVQGYYSQAADTVEDDADLAPYMSLFQKPFSHKKCDFSKHELEVMCNDPLHSPRLITYLINFVKGM